LARRLTSLLLLALAGAIFPAAAISQGPSNTDDLKVALHDVMAHGDLSDLPFISKTLGIGLRLTRPESRRTPYARPCCNAIATANPAALYATGLSWEASYRETSAVRYSRIDLTFLPRTCPPLGAWAHEWKLPLQRDTDPHGAASFEEVRWPVPGARAAHDALPEAAGASEGIQLQITRPAKGGCSGQLTQIKSREVVLKPPQSVSQVSGGLSASQIVNVAEIGDLRDYLHVASVLGADLIAEPAAARDGYLYDGHVLLGRVMPGTDPGSFQYYAFDTGWKSPPAFFYTPPHLAERTVTLRLELDTEALCISPTELRAELQRRAPSYALRNDGDAPIFEWRASNLISFGFHVLNGCVAGVGFGQITDIARNVRVPVVFPMSDLVDLQSHLLSAAANRNIDNVIYRLRTLNGTASTSGHPGELKEIDLYGCRVATSNPKGGNDRVGMLANAIADRLVAQGVAREQIKFQDGLDSASAQSCSDRDQVHGGADFVTLDAVSQ
jgi:hypothetical protein